MSRPAPHTPPRPSGRPAPEGLRSDSEVIRRAYQALVDGPLDDSTLLSRVLALPGAPASVARRVAESLLDRHEAFGRNGEGRWILRAPVADVAVVPALKEIGFAVVDVETTGGGAARGHRITEVAVVPVDEGRPGQVWSSLVNPMRPIPSQVMALTGITGAMVARAPHFRELAAELVERLRGRVFVAHNATFDWGFVTHEVSAALGSRLDGDRLCTLRLARVLLPQLRRRSLDALSYYFGIENSGRHRAGGDALATAHVLRRLLDVAVEQGYDTWPALSARLDRRTARARKRRRAMPRPVDYDTSS